MLHDDIVNRTVSKHVEMRALVCAIIMHFYREEIRKLTKVMFEDNIDIRHIYELSFDHKRNLRR